MIRHVLIPFLRTLAWLALRLRYRIRISGLDAIARKGTSGIIFLPNHPALVDPLIVLTTLHRRFALHALADRDRIGHPFVRPIALASGAIPLPDTTKYGEACREEVEEAVRTCIGLLNKGENVLLYPGGRIYRSHLEDVGGNSAVETILEGAPDARIVLLRTTGLWGSMFSRASTSKPDFFRNTLKVIPLVLANAIFFMPRREVSLEFEEPADLPRGAQRDEMNRYLEAFYNKEAPPNTYVPYYFWERGGARVVPEPAPPRMEGRVDRVPEGTRALVLERLRDASGKRDINDDDGLARDLGLDSLARIEIQTWLEKEFGFPPGDPDILQTVADVLLAACGQSVSGGPAELKPVARAWFQGLDTEPRPLATPVEKTITAAFLAQARRTPGRAIVADQMSGVRSYRDIITGILALRGEIQRVEGSYVGIMLPASVGAALVYFAALFSGKTPVMVNWTVGVRNAVHSLDLLGVKTVLTAGPLVQKLESQGFDFSDLRSRLVLLEDVRRRLPLAAKLSAALRSRLGLWGSLDAAPVSDTAVVLFTSGSESLPKAVPLTHTNILTNIRDIFHHVQLYSTDREIGILPPFHSFGLTCTVALPLSVGMPVVYHPNPTEGSRLARLVDAYRVSLLVGTPTFLNGILRAAGESQLGSLRVVVSGAEKCPDYVFDAIEKRWPQLLVLEGYGITECAPIVAANEERCPRRGSIGRTMPSLVHAVQDVETGGRAQTGKAGMLLVRGPSVFGGYLNYDGPSPFVEFEGERWYRTGDLVVEDSGGVLTFAGRLKRFVKIGGEMISLPAVEEVLARHYVTPADEEPVIAVESTPDESHPELVLFTVREIDREEANDRIRAAGLSPLYNIRRVIKIDKVPVLGTGKTNYRALRDSLRT